VRYDAASGPWTAQVLIDAPDMNSIDEQHRAVVAALAERSDVLVIVLHHQSVLEEASVSFVDAFAGRRQLLFVLNRADELTGAARTASAAQIRQLAATRWRARMRGVMVSARATGQPTPSWPDSARRSSWRGRAPSPGAPAERPRHRGTDRPLFGRCARTAEDLVVLPGDAASGSTGWRALRRRSPTPARRADLALLWAGRHAGTARRLGARAAVHPLGSASAPRWSRKVCPARRRGRWRRSV
jgi:hypothetical protein